MSEEEIEREGRAAWSRINEGAHYEDYVAVGQWLMEGRKYANDRAGRPNDLQNKKYKNEFSAWKKSVGLEAMDAALVKRVFEVMENIREIDEWREGLKETDPKKFRALNSPQAILKNWRASLKPKVEKPKAEKPAKVARFTPLGESAVDDDDGGWRHTWSYGDDPEFVAEEISKEADADFMLKLATTLRKLGTEAKAKAKAAKPAKPKKAKQGEDVSARVKSALNKYIQSGLTVSPENFLNEEGENHEA